MTTIQSMADLKTAINRLLDYNWADEERDYHEHEGENDDHIYATLLALDKWANGE